MEPVFVLVHSPSVGPLTWAPTAQALEARGVTAIVPSLLGIADAAPPFWPAVASTVATAIAQLPENRPVVIVAHSNAGLFVPVIVDASPRPVAGCVFVDAGMPPPHGESPVAPPEFLDFLRSKVVDDRLPQWTAWWDESDVAPMFPDPQTRADVSAEQPRLPLAYYESTIPSPPGWDARPCAYIKFCPAYDDEAAEAESRGWPVAHIPGEHLHQIVDPHAVATRIAAMTSRFA
ncbi:pimeloyl-ACP methyl ester carboxylesterase [Actinoplanes lutulentus]|uniref:Alpha/beta hydrolase family protein n=1 Tax=Actinoplanes lutulentus TaxID=1287878 RepID=A0A327Z6D5_9ACTN|nr:alpha/beta hydrolase [Actinoplanes lutulentus]MBB2947861.1 pimeloyl-ACP methyl ester carboxylesterase [Actinoplanes lutulentus]RAK29826.1 alpha/beta hydrolase family protein [Actinoplanes lutulentus]